MKKDKSIKLLHPVKKPQGKIGILMPGLGAVATTLIGGVIAARKGFGKPFGSVTQMGRIRIGKRTNQKDPLVKDFVPLASLDDLVFGGWDIFNENAYQAAVRSGVLDKGLLDKLKKELSAIKPMKGVFDRNYVKRLDGKYIKRAKTKKDLANLLKKDIIAFQKKHKCERVVMVWCGSTESYIKPGKVHQTLALFEKGLAKNDPLISPSMIYAYAALSLGVPYANGAPNLSNDIPALAELAVKNKVAHAGKDFKTGQTLIKTILAPGLKARNLGVSGWFSTNILGNRDGEVLDEESSFKSKEVTKSSVLDSILEPKKNPELYGNLYHKVRINYYPPRGDDKEGWDNIDIFGWLNYPMQIKVDFLCKDSILAAPIVLDLALFLDLAQRAGLFGIQEWLSFYFKSPNHKKGIMPINDLFKQHEKLENTLRFIMGEEQIHHLGLTYYGFDEEHNNER
jgi:myo-inositol-1-phosphate synthase